MAVGEVLLTHLFFRLFLFFFYFIYMLIRHFCVNRLVDLGVLWRWRYFLLEELIGINIRVKYAAQNRASIFF